MPAAANACIQVIKITTLATIIIALFTFPIFAEGENIKINTDATTQLQNEQACVINPNDPDNVVGIWRDFRPGFRQVGVGNTFDAGQNWVDSLLLNFPYNRVSDPVMSYTSDGDILACGLTYDDASGLNGLYVTRTTDGGQTWGPAWPAVDIGLPAIFEDKQWIHVDRTGGTYNDRVYIPWARFGATVDIYMVHSVTDISYSSPVQVSDVSSVQWPTVTVGSDGTVYCAWVAFNDATIKYDISADGGDTWGVDQTLTPVGITSTTIPGGITTFSFPAMDADITGGPYDGNIYILNANSVGATSELDLELRRTTDGGTSWSEPVRIHDDIVGNGIDQFHPWIQVNEDGILTAIWFDRRNDPSNLSYDLYMSHSFDAGDTWLANRRISEVSSSPFDAKLRVDDEFYEIYDFPKPSDDPQKTVLTPRAGLIGEYTGLSVREDQIQVIWTDTRNGNQDCYTARLTLGFGPPELIAPESSLITNNNQPTFSWTKSGPSASDLAPFTGTQVKALTYTLQVDDDINFASIDFEATDLTTTSHQFAAAIPDGHWYWRVYGVNSANDSTDLAEPARLLVIDTQPPSLPTLINPAQDDTIDFESPLFEWTDVSDGGTQVSYQLQIALDSIFTMILDDVSDILPNNYAGETLPDGEKLFYRVKATDAAINTSGFTAPNRFFTTPAYICGDADGNQSVSIADAVYIITYIFGGGPAPVPLESGEVNCDGNVSISDAVYLINYIFGGGTAPCAACP